MFFQATRFLSFNLPVSFEYQYAQLVFLFCLPFLFHFHDFRSPSFLSTYFLLSFSSPCSLSTLPAHILLGIHHLFSPLHSIRVSYFKLRKVGRVKGILYRLRFQAALFALLFVILSACLELGVHSHTFASVIIPNRIFPYCTQP